MSKAVRNIILEERWRMGQPWLFLLSDFTEKSRRDEIEEAAQLGKIYWKL